MRQQPRTKLRLSVFLAVAATIIAAPLCHAERPSIPFTSARVQRSDDGNFRVTWSAPGIARVQILAETDANLTSNHHIVATGTGIGSATIAGLAKSSRWYFDLVPDHGRDLTVADRSLHLTTVANLRDIGGYRNIYGQWVRMGLAYRSNELNRMSAGDLATLSALGIKLVCDLRTAPERQRGPDVVPAGVADINADVLADDSAEINAMFASPRDSQARSPSRQPTNIKEIYRDFVRLPSAQHAYHALFEKFADSTKLPTLFHCTAGKDRTGWAAAALLTLLDVPRATIVQDYALTNSYLQGETLKSLQSRLHQSGAPTHALTADAADLQAAFDEVDKDYGNFANYLNKGLGLDAAAIAAIRANFLTE